MRTTLPILLAWLALGAPAWAQTPDRWVLWEKNEVSGKAIHDTTWEIVEVVDSRVVAPTVTVATVKLACELRRTQKWLKIKDFLRDPEQVRKFGWRDHHPRTSSDVGLEQTTAVFADDGDGRLWVWTWFCLPPELDPRPRPEAR